MKYISDANISFLCSNSSQKISLKEGLYINLMFMVPEEVEIKEGKGVIQRALYF